MNKVYLEVHDTGKGIEKSRLQKILTFSSDCSVGLKNVYDRLSNLYGSEFAFKIKSVEGNGTTISISIPKEGVKEWLLEQLSSMTRNPQERN